MDANHLPYNSSQSDGHRLMLLMRSDWLSQQDRGLLSNRIPAHLVECRSHLQFPPHPKRLGIRPHYSRPRLWLWRPWSIKQVAMKCHGCHEISNPDSWVSSPIWDQNHQVDYLRPRFFKLKHLVERNRRISLEHMLPNGKPSFQISLHLSCQLQQTQLWHL